MITGAAPTSPRLFAAATFALLTRGGLLILGLLQGMLLARGLGPAGLGRYSAALVDVNLLVALLSLGLPGALAVLQSEAGAAAPSRRLALRRLAWQRGFLIIGLLAAAALAYKFVAPHFDRSPIILALIAAGVLVQYARDVENSLLWGDQRFSTQNRVNLLVQALLCTGLCTLMFFDRISPEAALALQLSSNLLWTIGAVLLRPASPISEPAAIDEDSRELSRRAFSVGLRNYLSLLIDLLVLRIDVYLIQTLLPVTQRESQLGLYQAGVRVAELVLMLPGTLNALLFAKAAAKEDVAGAALHSAKLSLWVGVFALFGMWLVGQPLLILFFGARFGGAFAPCLWVLAGCVAMCFSGPLAGTLQGDAGYPRSVVIAQGAALVVNVASNLYLLPRFGIAGAAAASAAAYTVSAIIICIAFMRRFEISASSILRLEAPWTLIARLRGV